MHCACATLSSVVCAGLQYFTTLSHKENDFRLKKVIEHQMRVSIFSTIFVPCISHSKEK